MAFQRRVSCDMSLSLILNALGADELRRIAMQLLGSSSDVLCFSLTCKAFRDAVQDDKEPILLRSDFEHMNSSSSRIERARTAASVVSSLRNADTRMLIAPPFE